MCTKKNDTRVNVPDHPGVLPRRNRHINRHLTRLAPFFFPLFCFPGFLQGKTRGIIIENAHPSRKYSTAELRQFEARMTSFLESRRSRRHRHRAYMKPVHRPSEQSLLFLAKEWDHLSPEFRTLYKEASRLPDSFKRFESPGGHFEILYTTTGINGVDPADTYGYGTTDWRKRREDPNGVPDYVDETAFALDSSWSMEIDRFGFVAPPIHKTELYTSDRYKVVIESQEESYYALTYLHDRVEQRGFKSSISLRNSWEGSEWSDLGYDKDPISGIRVTCAHEFFHAIQYGMSWDVQSDIFLDHFPYSWTEGAAVSMEELAFDSIDDYHQYASSYFNKPEAISFFSHSTMSGIVYTNSILFLYLYGHSVQGGGIDLVRTMMFSNYSAQLPFHQNLYTVAQQMGHPWRALLHNFHIASLYCGENADSTRFIPDASSFSINKPAPVSGLDRVSGTVLCNGVSFITLSRTHDHHDTVSIVISSAGRDNTFSEHFSGSVLLKNRDRDSLVPVDIDNRTNATCRITTWNSWEELTVILSNADLIYPGNVSVLLQPFPVAYPKSTIETDTLTEGKFNSSVYLRLEARRDLRGKLSIESGSGHPAGTQGIPQNYTQASAFYSLMMPSYWGEDAEVNLTFRTAPTGDPDTIALCEWNDSSGIWEIVSRNVPGTVNPVYTSVSPNSSGMFVVCSVPPDSANDYGGSRVEMFPNPFSERQSGGLLLFKGRGITGIRIYSIDGALVWTSRENAFAWNGKTASGAPAAPGTYSVIVTRSSAAGKRSQLFKLIVTP